MLSLFNFILKYGSKKMQRNEDRIYLNELNQLFIYIYDLNLDENMNVIKKMPN